MKKSTKVLLATIGIGVGVGAVANAQESHNSCFGEIKGIGTEIPDGAKVRAYASDMMLGQGYTSQGWYSIDNVKRDLAGTPDIKEGFSSTDSLYFDVTIDGDTTNFEASADSTFKQNKIPAFPTPGTDEVVNLYVRKKPVTGINSVKYDGKINVFPNPASRELSIDLEDGDFVKSAKVYGVDGRLFDYEMNGARDGVYGLNVEGLNPGWYFVTVETGSGKIATAKFIKN